MWDFLKHLDPLWYSLGPLVAVNIFALSTVPIFAYLRKKNPSLVSLGEVKKRHHSKLLSVWFKEYWYWINNPVEKMAIRFKLTPNFFTVLGVVISIGAGLSFYYGYVGIAGWLIILGGTCDLIDGRIARATQTSSAAGAFYDSVMDRYGEFFCLIGIAGYYRNSWMLWVVLLAMMGSMLVSYTRARGQAVGIDCDLGPMQRPERIVYLGVGSIFSPLFAHLLKPYVHLPVETLSIAALIMIALMTNFTALYRVKWLYDRLLEKK